MGEIELLALYWTVCGSGRGPRRPRVEPVRAGATAAREAAGSASRGSGCGTPTSSTSSRRRTLREMKQIFDDAGLKYLAGRVPGRLLRRTAAARARRLRRAPQAAVRHRRGVRRPPHQGRQHPRHAVRARQADRGVRGAVPGRRQPHQREGRLRVHAVRRQRQHARHRADAGRRTPTSQTAAWRSTPGTWASSGSRPRICKRIPPQYLTWVELSDGQFENMEDPIDEVVNHRQLPGEGEFDIPGYVEACRQVGYAGPWGVEVLSRGAAQPADRGGVSACIRDDDRAVRRGRRIDEERGR